MTLRDYVKIFGFGLAPSAVVVIGHALRIPTALVALLVALVGMCCVTYGVSIGWRT